MRKIISWTAGSFFRTIGRIFAFIVLGFIIAIIMGKLNIKIPFLTAKAFTIQNKYILADDYTYACTENNLDSYCNNNIVNAGNSIEFIDREPFYKYYFIYEDTYNGTNSNHLYYMINSNYKFTIVISKTNRLGTWVYNVSAYKTKMEITALEYQALRTANNYSNNYYDQANDKYYFFTDKWDEIYEYKISSSQWVSDSYGYSQKIFTQNVNDIYYYDSTTQLNKKEKNILQNGIDEYNVTFHINGGNAYNENCTEIGPCPVYTTDFTLKFINNVKLEEYINNLSVNKAGLIFKGWYYDQTLTDEYDLTESLTGDIDLYASYYYTSINEIINNINFNTYTFPDDKTFAIINMTSDYYSGVYLSFIINSDKLAVYRYDKTNGTFDDSAFKNLVSIGSRFENGNYYFYYHLDDYNFNEVDLIVIPKSLLVGINYNGEYENYYTFQVSDNASVTFTNDLTSISFQDKSGTTINSNIETSYQNNYEQQVILDNQSDVWTIFRTITSQYKNNTLYSKFSTIWAYFRGSYLYNYIFLVIIGSIIVWVLKVASRK